MRPLPSAPGHFWEQFILPGIVRGALLSLCNAASLAVKDKLTAFVASITGLREMLWLDVPSGLSRSSTALIHRMRRARRDRA
jgi:hypothetical protein